jgi:hypothetical protein
MKFAAASANILLLAICIVWPQSVYQPTIRASVSGTPAPPIRATFTIITPQDSLMAGVPIRAVVSIYNKDGPVPGVYCYPGAVYQDSLGKGTMPDPIVITDTTGIINGTPGTTNTVRQYFNNGIDTISFTLYRAPYANITDPRDTLHQLVVLLDSLSATTVPFKLNPGFLNRLQIEGANGVHLTGIDTLNWPSGAIMFYTVGYDICGNKRGRTISNWSVTGTLHQPGHTSVVFQIYFDASQATGNESGFIIARALRYAALNDSTGDSLEIVIKGPPSALDSAVTRDANGNAYLDEIELYFSGPVTFPDSFSLTNFTINYPTTVNNQVVNVPFLVESMSIMDSIGSKIVLHLAEDSTTLPGSPQTVWRPYISIAGLNGNSVPSFLCRDGAGPVIWRVTKTIANIEDRKQDVVRVQFSEPIQGPNGSPFVFSQVKPETVLNVFRMDSGGSFDTMQTLSPMLAPNGMDLLYISSFSRLVDDSTLEFTMSNGRDLVPNDYININPFAKQIFDSRSRSGGGIGVPPVLDNKKSRVICNGCEMREPAQQSKTNGKCGACGTGVGLAFIPPIGFRVASFIKNRKKRKP